MLAKEGIKNVKIKSCYYCGPEGRAVFIVEGESKEAVLNALNKINLPVASIMEAEEVRPK
jgi:nitrate reductase NapAB chaperone NapD